MIMTTSHKPTILLATGEPLTRDHAAQALGSGYHVLLAPDGIDAIRQYEKHGSRITAVIADSLLPRLSGDILAEWLHHIDPQLPIILLTGARREEASGSPCEDPYVRFVAKPLVRRKLRALLDATI
jgi:two-component system, cell cycle sensor histidine kinase and response regulator CckA